MKNFFPRCLNVKTFNVIQRLTSGCFVGLLPLVFSVSADAASIEVTASFKPDPGNPMRNEFINTTPFTGHCASYPEFCSGLSIFSILVPIEFSAIGPIEAGHGDMRKGAFFTPPTDWRPLQVTHRETGEQSTLQVRIASIGGRYYLPDSVQNIIGEGAPAGNPAAHEMLWGGHNWTYPPGPCAYTGGMFVEPTWRSFFWLTPPGATCAPKAAYRIESLRYGAFQIGYELRTPNPLQMSTGQYIGSYTYGVGPGRDFDMGDVMLPSDDSLTINFTLDVQHTLKVDIPPGGEKIQLLPAGGWQSWLQAGRRPVKLFRDQTFNISASSRFKMQIIACGPGFNGECGLQDSKNYHRVELHISVSMPNGITDLAGEPVKRVRLKSGNANALYFKPGFYVDRAPGTLHFEVPPHSMASMLQPGVSDRYSGGVVVVWDSDI
jgi:hypothetical protein